MYVHTYIHIYIHIYCVAVVTFLYWWRDFGIVRANYTLSWDHITPAICIFLACFLNILSVRDWYFHCFLYLSIRRPVCCGGLSINGDGSNPACVSFSSTFCGVYFILRHLLIYESVMWLVSGVCLFTLLCLLIYSVFDSMPHPSTTYSDQNVDRNKCDVVCVHYIIAVAWIWSVL